LGRRLGGEKQTMCKMILLVRSTALAVARV
jgi:hypothetical protein